MFTLSNSIYCVEYAFVGDKPYNVQLRRKHLIGIEMVSSNRSALARGLLDALVPKSVQAKSTVYRTKEKDKLVDDVIMAIRSKLVTFPLVD